ncbi:MAG: hypothetical protein QE263_00010 [Vampirovibrionales bacterium]|nr:hypothetical protein [Vampirovibrionales bacterium]
MNWILIAVFMVSFSTSFAFSETRIPTGQGDKGSYFLMEKSQKNGITRALTRRTGPSGTRFSLREFNCARQTFRYLSEGDTLSELKKRKLSNDRFVDLFEGSASWNVGQFVCKKQH